MYVGCFGEVNAPLCFTCIPWDPVSTTEFPLVSGYVIILTAWPSFVFIPIKDALYIFNRSRVHGKQERELRRRVGDRHESEWISAATWFFSRQCFLYGKEFNKFWWRFSVVLLNPSMNKSSSLFLRLSSRDRPLAGLRIPQVPIYDKPYFFTSGPMN